ncbi:MAG: hypothetical protein AAGA57_01780 [Planctomycetota bacterium]
MHATPAQPTSADTTDPSPQRTGVSLLSAIAAYIAVAFAVFALLSLAVALAFVVPSFRDIFADFDTEIPTLTVWIIQASGPVAGGGVAALAVALVAIAIAYRRRPGLVALLAILLLVAALLAMAITAISLFLPLTQVMQSVP